MRPDAVDGDFVANFVIKENMSSRFVKLTVGVVAIATAAIATPARAELSAEELAKLAQNPVGNLISVPFQNNTNLNFGPEKGTQNVLNIQPVIPFSVVLCKSGPAIDLSRGAHLG